MRTRAAIAVACAAIHLWAGDAIAAAGSRDPAFGTDGVVRTAVGRSRDLASSVGIQADGKFVVAGSSSNARHLDFAVTRMHADGSIDTSFGRQGRVITNIGPGDEHASGMAIQPDGKILIAGSAGTVYFEPSKLVVVRYNSDGSLDGSFGSNGVVLETYGEWGSVAYAIALQPDNKIVVAGRHFRTEDDSDFLIVRYNADGSLDGSFGAGGKVIESAGPEDEWFIAIALQSDGRIVAAGSVLTAGIPSAILARYNADGSPDTAFGTQGKVVQALGSGQKQATAVKLQPNGNILVGGLSSRYALARYLPNGSLDGSFGTAGLVSQGSAEYIAAGLHAMDLQGDGKIVFVGNASPSLASAFGIVRLLPDGARDAAFGTGGMVTTYLGHSPSPSGSSNANDVAIQANGRIVVVGTAPWNQSVDIAAARYDTAGALDPSFGTGGTRLIELANGADGQWNAVAIQPDGRIVAAGKAVDAFKWRFALARFDLTGDLDLSFGEGGAVVTAVSAAGESAVDAIMIRPDGKIVAAGSNDEGSAYSIAVARYHSNGALDSSFGTGGVWTVSVPMPTTARAAALQADGKIVIAIPTPTTVRVMRVNANGSLDATFGSGGFASTPVSGAVMAVRIQPDGKIVFAGSASFATYDFTVGRLNPDGTMDAAFGSGGWVHLDLAGYSDTARDLAIQPDGRIVVAGTTSIGDSGHFALARLLPDGSLDGAFGTSGHATTPMGSYVGANAVGIQADGRILVAGHAATFGSSTGFGVALVRFLSNGALDSSFGTLGKVITAAGDAADAMAIAPDGAWAVVAGGVEAVEEPSFLVRFLLGSVAKTGGDIDGDSKSDVFFRKTDGTNYVWHIDGATISGGSLAIASQGLLPSVDASWFVAGMGDFNGDGKADILWRNSSGTNYVWHLDGATISGGMLTIVSQGLLPSVDASWAVAGIADFNGDGKADIFWRKDDGTNYVWHVDGASISGSMLSIVSQGLLPSVPMEWSVAGVGDFNGDVKGDVYWRRSDGTNYVWHVDGAVISASMLSIPSQGLLPGVDASWSVVATGDYNGDGKSDIFFRKADGTNYVWHVNGAVISGGMLTIASQGLLPSVDATWTLAGQGDYNGDGKADVFWRKDDGTNYIWHVDGATITGGLLSIPSQGLLPGADTSWTVINPK